MLQHFFKKEIDAGLWFGLVFREEGERGGGPEGEGDNVKQAPHSVQSLTRGLIPQS